ncbi:MAG TPA: tannase/feruloyl esterase family alpha/beta hydrolase [Steroidobacteraceae bacterium]|nr:tannase/feruloyl esterase family alpha/beta hydrolase [Steroidobacteraceae bacterium]
MAGLAASPAQAADAQCEALKLPAGTQGQVLQRQLVAAGTFQPEGGPELQGLPAFCRVAAALHPTPQSDIRIEVWLPLQGWNGKFLGVGNGGFSGSISHAALADGVKRGYATASTNTGHEGGSGRFALGQPQKVIDFGYRAVHEMTGAAKQMVRDFYRRAASRAYWNGCSAGGRQGLQSAQRYPKDYDGIVAGAPALDWTGRASSALRVAAAVRASSDSALDAAAMNALHRGALAACDADDGVADGVISDPPRCRFDPAAVQCGAGQSTGCLSPAQVAAARALYASPPNPATGRPITGLFPGSEAGWNTWAGPAPFATAVDHFRYVVNGNPDWSPASFRFERDAPRAEAQDANTLNALNPDLRAFFRRGGKLIQYHGWSDPQISPGVSPQYYESVVKRIGSLGTVTQSYRLFMVPGMAHCSGGEGADRFDMLAALEDWVERGRAPDEIPAHRERGGRIDRTRRLCAYPAVPRHVQGNPDDATGFRCVMP